MGMQTISRIAPQPGPQTKFLSTNAQIAIFGGSAGAGKTFSLLMEPLRHLSVPNFGATFLRRSYKQFINQGGLWAESQLLYPLAGGRSRETDLTWRFPSGMNIQMRHLQYDKTVYDFHGAQIPLILWDELTHFTEFQFFYMLSRNRSATGVPAYMRGTCNPDPDSFLADMVSWYLQEDGYPDYSKSGKIRWFIRLNDEIVWADSKEELEHKYKSDTKLVLPKSFTFIPATIYDNQALLEKDPGYLASLHALPEVEQDRLLGGNWKISSESGGLFNKDNVLYIDQDTVPQGGLVVRFFDLAATAPSKVNRDPDYTASVKMKLTDRGQLIIMDVTNHQLDPQDIDDYMENLIKTDIQEAINTNSSYMARWESEPGGAGKRETYRLVTKLRGIDAAGIRPNGDKFTRAKPFAAQFKNRNVFLVKALWNKTWLNQLHRFPLGKHDDMVDATSGAETALTSEFHFKNNLRAKSQSPIGRRISSKSRSL